MIRSCSSRLGCISLSKVATSLPKHLEKSSSNRSFFTVINQAEVAYREFFGMNRIRLEPGIRLALPFVHEIHRVSLREDMVSIRDLHCFSKDNVPVSVTASVFYKVMNAEKTCFTIQNIHQSLNAISDSAVRATVGNFAYDEAISKRSILSNAMLVLLGKSAEDWGIQFTRLEIRDYKPQNAAIADHLEKQMKAERARRQNELDTSALIKSAEGKKQCDIYHAEAQSFATRTEADATSYKLNTEAKALADQISLLSQTLNNQPHVAANLLLEMKRLEKLTAIAQTGNSTYFIPPDSMFPTAKVISDLVNSSKTK